MVFIQSERVSPLRAIYIDTIFYINKAEWWSKSIIHFLVYLDIEAKSFYLHNDYQSLFPYFYDDDIKKSAAKFKSPALLYVTAAVKYVSLLIIKV